jgi:hypothetical protein
LRPPETAGTRLVEDPEARVCFSGGAQGPAEAAGPKRRRAGGFRYNRSTSTCGLRLVEEHMFTALVLSGAIALATNVRPPDYTERSLCELWAGAMCQKLKCVEGAKARCQAESKRCRGQPYSVVPKDRAAKVAECAKALLKQKCGEPEPAECSGVGF